MMLFRRNVKHKPLPCLERPTNNIFHFIISFLKNTSLRSIQKGSQDWQKRDSAQELVIRVAFIVAASPVQLINLLKIMSHVQQKMNSSTCPATLINILDKLTIEYTFQRKNTCILPLRIYITIDEVTLIIARKQNIFSNVHKI